MTLFSLFTRNKVVVPTNKTNKSMATPNFISGPYILEQKRKKAKEYLAEKYLLHPVNHIVRK